MLVIPSCYSGKDDLEGEDLKSRKTGTRLLQLSPGKDDVDVGWREGTDLAAALRDIQ